MTRGSLTEAILAAEMNEKKTFIHRGCGTSPPFAPEELYSYQ